MKIVIDIPEEQIKKSLEESKYINEDEGVKGSVHIAMLYTNTRLEFVDVERKTDFYSCEYKMLPKGHGRLIDADALKTSRTMALVAEKNALQNEIAFAPLVCVLKENIDGAPTIIEADNAESEE